MRDIKQFMKLYKVPIPCEDEFDYYIRTLLKSKEWSKDLKLKDNILIFENWESSEEKVHHSYRKWMSKLIDVLRDTDAYIMLLKNYPARRPSIKPKSYPNNEILVSIDMKSANWTSLQLNDKNRYYRWEEFCKDQGVPYALSNSKSFRQIVMGNLNSKRQQAVQHNLMCEYRETFRKVKDEDVILCNNDEIIMRASSMEHAQGIIELRHSYLVDMHTEIRTYSKAGDYQVCEYQTIEGMDVADPIKKLHGVPRSFYFQYFKKYILEEDIVDEDLYFMNEGKTARWVEHI